MTPRSHHLLALFWPLQENMTVFDAWSILGVFFWFTISTLVWVYFVHRRRGFVRLEAEGVLIALLLGWKFLRPILVLRAAPESLANTCGDLLVLHFTLRSAWRLLDRAVQRSRL